MMMIKVYDNFLSPEEQQDVIDYCECASYNYGESDDGDTPPTGVTHNIPKNDSIYRLFEDRLKPVAPKGNDLYRMYINCFAPSEIPYFHTDGDDGVTFLYYPQEDWEPNDGGETQLYVRGNIQGIVPIPNRLLAFDADILHRATTFRNRYRFTVAIKYE
jgi:hypothetical protein